MKIARWRSAWLIVLPLMLAILAPVSSADTNRVIQVVGLYEGKAAVRIGGHLRLLTAGQPSPEGVVLLRADSYEAVLRVDGVEQHYRLHEGQWGPISTPVPPKRLSLAPNIKGLYVTPGSINGSPVSFIVDTGANAVALSEPLAQALHLDYRIHGHEASITTAAGVARGWQILLDTVRVGDFLEHAVDAVVIEGNTSPDVLLGLTFLRRLNLRHEGDMLYLEAHTP